MARLKEGHGEMTIEKCKCPRCDGSGVIWRDGLVGLLVAFFADDYKTCPVCKGWGYREIPNAD
jgi:hypothetical protein